MSPSLEHLVATDRADRARGEARTRRKLTEAERLERRRAADEAMARVDAAIALRSLTGGSQ